MKFGTINHILFLGGGTLLTRVLAKAQEKGFSYTVVTSERHLKDPVEGAPSLESYFKKHGIPFHVSQDVNTDLFVKEKMTSQTLGVSLSAAWIFKEPFIRAFQGRFVNLHGSLLPQDRGGGGSTWPILRNAKTIGATIHLVDPGIDTGDIVLQWSGALPSDALPKDHHALVFKAGETLFGKLFDAIKRGSDVPLSKQDESKSMYWPRLSTATQGFVNWSWNGEEIERFIRAFSDPYPGAMTFAYASKGKEQVRLTGASFKKGEDFHPFQSGIIYRIDEEGFHIATCTGTLSVSRIELMDGKDARSFISVGDRLYTPQDVLESALTERIIYTPKGLKK